MIPICYGFPCLQPNDLEISSAGDMLILQRRGRYHSRCLANFQSGIALSLANRLVKRKNDEFLAKTRDKHGWPVLVISNLHRDDRAGRQRINLGVESARALFDITEAARNLAC